MKVKEPNTMFELMNVKKTILGLMGNPKIYASEYSRLMIKLSKINSKIIELENENT